MPVSTPLNLDLLTGARRLKVAFSGGCDSTVLLHMLCGLREQMGWQELQAVHVHHGLQQAADQWERHCQEVCDRLAVPLQVLHIRVPSTGASAEDRARKARYRAWEELLQTGDVLALAHHADDQAETVLMRLLRGAGPTGMAGMPATRSLGAGALARPLLEVSRDELHRYALQHQLNWVEDPENENPSHDRNFIRHRVLPLLQQHWPGASASIRRSGDIARQTGQLCSEIAAEDMTRCSDSQGSDGLVHIGNLSALPPIRRRMLIVHWCTERGLSPPPARQLSRVDDLLSAAPDRSPALYWRDFDGSRLCIRRYRKYLYLLKPEPLNELPPSVPWNLTSQPNLSLPHGELRALTGKGGLHPDRLAGLEVRFRQGGEQIRQAGRGCAKPLRKYLQEIGIPPWLRSGLPLIYARGTLAAVSDICVCEGFAAEPGQSGLQLAWQPR